MQQMKKALLKAGLRATKKTPGVYRACYLLHLPTGQHVSIVTPPQRLWDGSLVSPMKDHGVAIFKNPALAGRCRDSLHYKVDGYLRMFSQNGEWWKHVTWWPKPEIAIGLVYPVHTSLMGKINFEIVHTEEPWNIDRLMN